MRIAKLGYSMVEVEDDQMYRSTVYLQSNGRWKCLRCQRLTCTHVKFVQREKPVPLELPPLSPEDMAELIDE